MKSPCCNGKLETIASTDILWGIDWTPGWGITTEFAECEACHGVYARDTHLFSGETHVSGQDTTKYEPFVPYGGTMSREEIVFYSQYHAGHMDIAHEEDLRDGLRRLNEFYNITDDLI